MQDRRRDVRIIEENKVAVSLMTGEVKPGVPTVYQSLTRDISMGGVRGKTLTEVAALRGSDTATAFMELIAASEAMREETGLRADMIIGTSMHPDDVAALIAWAHSNICTDGYLIDLHPRGAGFSARARPLRARAGRGKCIIVYSLWNILFP